jgi:hypothetical protein
MKVLELANKKTPNSFIVACDRFVYIEVLDGAIKERTKRTATDAKKGHTKKSLNKIDLQTIELIESTIEDIGDDSGWAFLGDGNLIVKKTRI